MARQVLTIGGAIVGSFFGMPQLGFAIGSLIGNAVDPVQIQGPKIGDLPVQTSRDGVPRPIVYGTAAVMGNIIDRGEPKIVKKKEKQGKGGPETVTEHVYMSFAIRVCEGPVLGITRIWENEKLVYDITPGSTIVKDSTKFKKKVKFYLGGESQLPDPTLEGIHGVGSTPAHRGTCYVVFKNSDLTGTGGAIPQYRFEVNNSVPSGNVWLTIDTSNGELYLGNYLGTAWTSLGTSSGLAAALLVASPMIRAGDNVYVKQNSDLFYASVTNLNSASTISASGTAQSPFIMSDGTYLHTARDVTNGYNRLTLPSGAFSNPVVSGDADCQSLTYMNGVLYGPTSNSTSLRTSSDNGLNWTNSGSHGKTMTGGTSVIANDGTNLVFAYLDGGDSKIHIMQSGDDGATWTERYVFPVVSQPIDYVGIQYYDGKFLCVAITGECAYSSNGTTWTAGATVPSDVLSTMSAGEGCLVVGSKRQKHYITYDHGASWSLFGAPVAASVNDSLFLNTHWIGDPV